MNAFLASLLIVALFAQGPPAKPPAQALEPPLPADVSRMDSIVGRSLPYDRMSLGTAAHGRPCRGIYGPSGGGAFDIATGILVTFRMEEQPTEDATNITVADARSRARGFARRAGITLDPSWFEDSVVFPQADGRGVNRSYYFVWFRYQNGLRLPAMLSISVHAVTGEVGWLHLYDDPVTVSIRPSVSAEQAALLAAARAGYERWKLRAPPQLQVHYNPVYPGPQVLHWVVEIDNLDGRGNVGRNGLRQHHEAYVDAHTGRVTLNVALSSGAPSRKEAPSSPHDEPESTKPGPKPPPLDLKKLAAEPLPPTLFKEKGQKEAVEASPMKGKPAREPD